MKARLITEVGTRAWLRRYWGEGCTGNTGAYHNAQVLLGTSQKRHDWHGFGAPEDFGPERWAPKCDGCGIPVPDSAERQVFTRRMFDSPSGDPEPGDLFYEDLHWDTEYSVREGKPCTPTRCVSGWSNCNEPHLVAVLPSGEQWDIDSRASNCDMRADQLHRCWVRHGAPPAITVDKAGHTCHAGAGSILTSRWHGFLTAGEFRSC